ncbi:hypothetical protein LO749_16550 [Paracoccus denitrificans]|uniref:hypothetical protein n=1 Tax=Paracoccus denitrificans TaxID=266 RepID=UPI001E617F38|nr:hypothetical protein [Paracoccus denitrificans]UFS67706.1 hypothetical protein LO749_16550 [Paracoccus denitrificans]
MPARPPCGSAHQQCERLFDRREIRLVGHDCKERVGPGGEVREMIAGRCHHEMEVAVCFAAIAFGHNCFEGSCGLLERRACLVRVAVEFEEAQTQAKQAISVTVEIETELWRKGGRVRRESTVTPDHCAGLAARNKPAAKARRRCVGDRRCDRVRGGWHRL